MTQFTKGVSPNPSGRPRGITDKRSELRSLLTPHAKDLVQKAIDMALGGDVNALRLCIERLIPRVKDEVINLDFIDLDLCEQNNLLLAGSSVLQAVASGVITPEHGKSIAAIIEAQRKTIESSNLHDRMAEIEHALKIRKKS